MTPELVQLKSNFVDVIDANANTEVLTLAGELSSRKYYRILVKKASEEHSTPSYVLQAAESFNNPERHPFLLAQQVFMAVGIRVPKIFGVAGQEGWILVEDCGDFFLQYRQELALYRQALEMLYCLQGCRGPEGLGLSQQLTDAPHWEWSFDFEKLNAEMLHAEKYFVTGLIREDFAVAKMLANNSEFLAAQPRVLCHRDFHSRNLLVKDNLIYAIDFQDARMGPVTYDLVSLLWDPYANLQSDLRETLLSEWKANTKIKGETLDEEIHRMKIQRLIKAIGSYSSFYLVKGNPSCFVFIEGALADTCASFAALSDMSVLTNSEKKTHNWLERVYQKVKGQ